MELSERLSAVAGLVTEGASVADIGTDHGYIPVYLMEHGIAEKVLALDVNEGPLKRAGDYIRRCGWEGYIETRLSDGLQKVRPGEADTMIAAGMGGGLITKILSEGSEVLAALDHLILQPQSEIWKVRRYLNDHGYQIMAEDMVLDGGKYYTVMKAGHGEPEFYGRGQYLYGKRLLEGHHPVLCRYLRREIRLKEQIMENLQAHGEAGRAQERRKDLLRETEEIKRLLAIYYGGY